MKLNIVFCAMALTTALNTQAAFAKENIPAIIRQKTSLSERELYEYIRHRELSPIAIATKHTPVSIGTFDEKHIYIFGNAVTQEWLITSPSVERKFSIDHHGHSFLENMNAANATPVSLSRHAFNICANITDRIYDSMEPVFAGLDSFGHLVNVFTSRVINNDKLWSITVRQKTNPECGIYGGRSFTPYTDPIGSNDLLADFENWPDYEMLSRKGTTVTSLGSPEIRTGQENPSLRRH